MRSKRELIRRQKRELGALRDAAKKKLDAIPLDNSNQSSDVRNAREAIEAIKQRLKQASIVIDRHELIEQQYQN